MKKYLLIFSFLFLHVTFFSEESFANYNYSIKKPYGFTYAEGKDWSQYILYKNIVVVNDTVKNCDVTYSLSEEKSPLLMSRKCMNDILQITNIWHNWVKITYLKGNFYINTFFHTKSKKTKIWSDLWFIYQIESWKTWTYILVSNPYDDKDGYSVYSLSPNWSVKKVFYTHTAYSNTKIQLLLNWKIRINYSTSEWKSMSEIFTIK